MEGLFKEALNLLHNKEDVVLVTIVAGSGSTPRGVGARMLVCADGSSRGTIGGGNVEYQASLRAKKVLANRESAAEGYNLAPSQTAGLGMVCGGEVAVYFQYISHQDMGFQEICKKIIRQYQKDEDSWIIMDITDNKAWHMGMYSKSEGVVGIAVPELSELLMSGAVRVTRADKVFYAEPILKAGKVFVFGGGHVAQELVPVLGNLGFRCVVLDDREEFVEPGLFPAAQKTILCDFQKIDQSIQVTGNDYVVIMTRGHQFDYEVQAQVMGHFPCYIGIMGSKNKIRFVTDRLLKDGFTKEAIEFCHMPIGTDIKAETPAEIAISIAGELIKVRAAKGIDEPKYNGGLR